jgi:hypothetical protein
MLTCSEAYDSLKGRGIIRKLSEGRFEVDLLAVHETFDKNVLGLFCGTFLSIRTTEGRVGSLSSCPVCKTAALQKHFLNECPTHRESRETLKQSIAQDIRVQHLSEDDFHAFFLSLRSLEICSQLEEAQILEQISGLGRVVCHVASQVVHSTMSMFNKPETN